jgi:hypothetical protein
VIFGQVQLAARPVESLIRDPVVTGKLFKSIEHR